MPGGIVAGIPYDYKIEGYWTDDVTPDQTWICWGLTAATPAELVAPTGLVASTRNVGAGLMSSGGASSTAQVAVALNWSLPRGAAGGLAAASPVFYHVVRNLRRPNGSWGGDKTITAGAPVVVAAVSALPSTCYSDGPLALGTYRYRAYGVDLFGGRST